MKKQIYFVQTNSVFGSGVRSAYLPYAVGSIAAYAWADKEICKEYELMPFIFMREDIETLTDKMNDPFMVALSCYVWSMEYNKALAKRVKEKYPQCLVLMGGHNISPGAQELEKYPYVDILIHGEGEVPFKELLLAFKNNDPLGDIANISFRDENGAAVTTVSKLPDADIASFPSPYLEGYFDDILKDDSLKYSVIWETNRGCPNRCAYCDWGVLKSKVRMFPMERISKEIEWMSKNHIEFIYCADANFGLFDRDEEITDLMIKSKRATGYPEIFKTNFTKNRDDFVFMLSKRMFKEGLGKSPTLSFQTMSPEALKNIGRSNISLEHFKNLMKMYAESGIMAYSELILGLPGETYESFAGGIESLLECGQHKSLVVYPCELLPNSELGKKENVEKYQFKLCRTEFRQHHSAVEEHGIKEYSNNIIGTYSMNTGDWKRSYAFAQYIQGFHSMCLTVMPAMYLYEEKGVGYRQFYESFLAWCAENPGTFCGRLYDECGRFIDDVINGKDSFKSVFEGFGDITWGFDEYLFMKCAVNADVFYGELRSFLLRYDIDSELFDALMTYQQHIIKKMNTSSFVFETEYDFEEYFNAIFAGGYVPLKKRHCRITLTEKEPVDTIEDYARKYIWYGRRDEAPIYSQKRGSLRVEYI
ncbi:MAG: radical SAM protein [Clostridia bacterium]|nr:radical SAM protein [Clostridia bacterium]